MKNTEQNNKIKDTKYDDWFKEHSNPKYVLPPIVKKIDSIHYETYKNLKDKIKAMQESHQLFMEQMKEVKQENINLINKIKLLKAEKDKLKKHYDVLSLTNERVYKENKILDSYRADNQQLIFRNKILERNNQVLEEDNKKMLNDIQLISNDHTSLQELVNKQKKEIEILKQKLKEEQIERGVARQLFRETNKNNEELKNENQQLKQAIEETQKANINMLSQLKILTQDVHNYNKKLLPNQMKYISKVENKKQNYNTRKRYVLIPGLDTRPKFNIYCSKEHLRNKQVNNY